MEFKTLIMGMLAVPVFSALVEAHVGHDHGSDHTHIIAQAETARTGDEVSGQGEYVFKVAQTREILPEEALAVLENAHGGFAVDRREGKGDVYFALPGAGIIRLTPDLSSAEMLATDEAMKSTNMHNATIWFDEDETPRLVFPANQEGKVFTTSLDGELLDTLSGPDADFDFSQPAVNTYFDEGGNFVPTDVEYLDEKYFITTGYSSLDYVLSAHVHTSPFATHWHDLAFAGKGTERGQLQTGHGITIPPEGNFIDVADRPVAQIERYTRYGHYLSTVELPEGAFPCDIDYAAGLAIVPCLHGKDRDKGAPIYLLENGEVVSTIMIKEDLNMERFQHIHNAVLTERDGKLYIIAQAWNPGDFVVLEQVTD